MIRLIASILFLPLRFISWVRDNGLKGWIAAGALLLFIVVLVVVAQTSIRNSQGSPSYSEQLLTPGPDRAEAPYKIVTDTRVYYAYIAIKDKTTGNVTMTDYWELSHDEWQETKGILILDQNFGDITVSKRSVHE